MQGSLKLYESTYKVSGEHPLPPSQKRRCGKVHVITGPMFSGKTEELLRRIRRYTVAGQRCELISYCKDLRYSSDGGPKVVTHNLASWPSIPASRLSEIFDEAQLDGIDVIGIDEGQFFEDLVETVERWANSGIFVVVAGLITTFERKPFMQMLSLLPLAEGTTKLSAICVVCNDKGSFSLRTSTETNIEVIGGSDKYIAVCRTCYFNLKDAEKILQ